MGAGFRHAGGQQSSAGLLHTIIDPRTKRIVALFNPRTQVWATHFELRGVLIVGRTAIGWATVRVLQRNVEDRLKLRAALRDAGELFGE